MAKKKLEAVEESLPDTSVDVAQQSLLPEEPSAPDVPVAPDTPPTIEELPEPTPRQVWLKQARDAEKVLARGDVVSAADLRALLLAAIPLIEAAE